MSWVCGKCKKAFHGGINKVSRYLCDDCLRSYVVLEAENKQLRALGQAMLALIKRHKHISETLHADQTEMATLWIDTDDILDRPDVDALERGEPVALDSPCCTCVEERKSRVQHQKEKLEYKVECRQLGELVREGYALSTYAAAARQECTVDYLEGLYDRIEAFQPKVPEELRVPAMNGLRPKMDRDKNDE